MQCAFGDEHLIAGLANELAAGHLHLEPPFGDGHQFVSSVDEVVPFATRRINELAASVSPRAPVLNFISHGLAETFNPVLQADQLEFGVELIDRRQRRVL